VYAPLAAIVPSLALHVTPVTAAPPRAAVNVRVVPGAIVANGGDTSSTGSPTDPSDGVVLLSSPHPPNTRMIARPTTHASLEHLIAGAYLTSDRRDVPEDRDAGLEIRLTRCK